MTKSQREIIQLNDRRPHGVQSVECGCGKQWVAVFPVLPGQKDVDLECPGCGSYSTHELDHEE